MDAYLVEIRRSFACLGAINVRGDRFTSNDVPHILYVNHGRPIDLASPLVPLQLRVRQRYTFQQNEHTSRSERWGITVSEYSYTLLPPMSAEGDKALMAFHWHPATEVSVPHIHVYSAVCSHDAIMNSHIPSGHIEIEDVLEYLLRDWKVDSALPEVEWRRVLAAARRRNV